MLIRLLGLGCLLAVAVMIGRTALFLRDADRAEGIVMTATAHPSVRFTDARGAQVDFVQNGFLARPPGTEVPVAYDPRASSTTARVVTFWTTWGTAVWLAPFGLAAGLAPWLWSART